jgi:hypothetical protein
MFENNQMKNFWKKYTIQIVLAGYCLFLGLFVHGIIFTRVENIKNKADEIQKKAIDKELDNENLTKIPQLIGDYEVFAAQENNLNVVLGKESEIEFIKLLENLAKETGNEINLKLIEDDASQIKSSQTKTKAKDKDAGDIKSNLPEEEYIMIQLELKGGYPELMRFLEKLERMDYYTNVVSFNLKKEDNQMEESSSNPFVGTDTISVPTENNEKTGQKKEILKSLIDLVVYIRQ